MISEIERADRISRSRALAAPFIGVAALSVQQWLFFGREWDELSSLQLGIWAILAALALLVLIGGGKWLTPRSLRPFVHDESSRDNRLKAIFGGFTVAMLTALLVFLVSPFEPLSAQRAAHIIISMGLGVSLLSFGITELRALD
jgi:hypothetical protein